VTVAELVEREVRAKRLTPRQAAAFELIWRSFRRTSRKVS
jgi:hypothetical protein